MNRKKGKIAECPCCGSKVKKQDIRICDVCEGAGKTCPKCEGDE